jgi:hypothetical protein
MSNWEAGRQWGESGKRRLNAKTQKQKAESRKLK